MNKAGGESFPLFFLPVLPILLFSLAGLYLSLHLYIRSGGYLYDDAYITFKYARHFANGRGLIYQEGSTSLGTTAPLFAILLGSLHRITRMEIPLLSVIVGGACLGACASLVWLYFPSRRRWVRLFSALLVLSNPMLWKLSSTGMETGLFLLLLTGTVVAPLPASALIGAASAFVRPEGALFAFIRIALDRSSRLKARLAALALFAIGILVGATLVVSSGTTPIPQSITAKARFFSVVFPSGYQSRAFLENLLFDTLAHRLFFLLFVAGSAVIFRHPRQWKWLAFPALSLAIFAFLYGRNFPIFPWYLAPLAQSTILLAFVVADQGMEVLKSRGITRAGCLLVPLVLCLAIIQTVRTDRRVISDLISAQRAQSATTGTVVQYLLSNARPNQSILLPEIGLIGFTTNLRILDWGGIISPELSPFISTNDLFGAISSLNPDFFLYMIPAGHKSPFQDPHQQALFEAAYEEALRLPREPPLGDYVLFRHRLTPLEPQPLHLSLPSSTTGAQKLLP